MLPHDPWFDFPAANASQFCDNGEVRLVGTEVAYEGQVEVCFNGHWGTVCDDNWGTVDALTVCQILGYGVSGVAIPTIQNFFGVLDFSKPILLDEVACTGNETDILECLSVNPGEHDCIHALNAGVFCSGK